MGGGSSQAPRAEQQRRCSHRSLESILCCFPRLLGFRDGWPMEQAETFGRAAANTFFEAPPPGKMPKVCGRGRGCCSDRLSFRFGLYGHDRVHQSGKESPQSPPGVLTHHAHAASKLMNSPIPNYIKY